MAWFPYLSDMSFHLGKSAYVYNALVPFPSVQKVLYQPMNMSLPAWTAIDLLVDRFIGRFEHSTKCRQQDVQEVMKPENGA